MATKGKKTKETETKITRITAKDDTTLPKKQAATKLAETKTSSKKDLVEKRTKNPFKAVGGYFKGAWQEVKQVRWPTRRATWSMTFAMLGYTAFFVIVILLLDALFKYLFELMLG